MSDSAKCPVCGRDGNSVDSATVKSMLAISLREVRDVPYHFCANRDCDVVYYSDDSSQTFTTAQVRERVYQKEPESDNVLICYCFQHSAVDIYKQFAQSHHVAIIADIKAGIHAGQCACDWRNPQGSCCLGNVTQLLKQLQLRD